jgi:glycerophosphoryl diester phosphodiesterase
MNDVKHCLIFAHRGASKEAAENTRSAFDRALGYATDGIETDVQLTRDEITVLWHDRFLDKVGLPKNHIDDFNYRQLKSMQIIGQPASKEYAGIMSLQAFVDTYRKRCRLLIEIKNREWESILRHEIKVRQTLNIVGPKKNDPILVSSFNLASLIYAHHYRPDIPLIYNLEPENAIAETRYALAAQPFLHGFCVPISDLDDALADLLQAHNKCMAVYTCNSDEEISKALKCGADILISDLPQKAIQMRNAYET